MIFEYIDDFVTLCFMLGGVVTYRTKFRNKPFKQGFPDTACDVLGSTQLTSTRTPMYTTVH